MRILGLKKAVGEIKGVPEGFHVEVWSELRGEGEVAVWTTEYLSSNSWTINHEMSERRLDAVMREIDDGHMSLTEQIRRAVSRVWEDKGLLYRGHGWGIQERILLSLSRNPHRQRGLKPFQNLLI